MNSLLDQLAGRRQFVVYKLVPKPDGSGRHDKIPCDPFTMANINAQDDRTWLGPHEAALYADGLGQGYGVGVVIYEGCGLAAIDLDSCRESSGGWMPHVGSFLAMFPGSYFEASVSLTGAHIFVGYTGTLPAHRTRNSDYRAEAYSKERFIALGTGLTGSVLVDNGEALRAFLATYFPPREEGSAEWTDRPCEGASPIKDDAALILRALRSSSANVIFGRGASFSDLWTGNAEALGRAFPPQSVGQSWDGSAADLALANHLAFWTGNDCERMAKLMRQSSLVRSKWDRADYFTGTILRACASQTEWYHERVPDPPTPPAVSGTDPSPVPPPPATVVQTGPLKVNAKGLAEASLPNLRAILGGQQTTRLGFDTFRDRIMIAPADTEVWQPLRDADMIQLRCTLELEQNFAPVSKDMMRDALQLVADRHRFDSAIVWLSGLVWDGQPRAEQFLPLYCGTQDDDYTRAVSRYIWTGLACRVFEPGCQLDMVVALFSKQQGLYKSSALAEMVPDPDFFTDGLDLHRDDDNFKRMMRGKLVIEIAEMSGISKADVTLVKRAITRRTEKWIEKWQTLESTYPRRCMLFATTNEEQFLPKDDSGQRRWLPAEIARIARDLIKRDRDQLWAEGAAMYRIRKAAGLPGVNFEEAEALASGRHAKHEQGDVWSPAIERWLSDSIPAPDGVPAPPPCARPFTTAEVLLGALLMDKSRMDSKSEKRVATVLRQLGYEKRWVRVDGKPRERWVLAA